MVLVKSRLSDSLASTLRGVQGLGVIEFRVQGLGVIGFRV